MTDRYASPPTELLEEWRYDAVRPRVLVIELVLAIIAGVLSVMSWMLLMMLPTVFSATPSVPALAGFSALPDSLEPPVTVEPPLPGDLGRAASSSKLQENPSNAHQAITPGRGLETMARILIIRLMQEATYSIAKSRTLYLYIVRR